MAEGLALLGRNAQHAKCLAFIRLALCDLNHDVVLKSHIAHVVALRLSCAEN